MTTWLPRWIASLVLLLPSVALAPLAIAFIASPLSQAAPPDESEASLSADLKLLKEAGVQTDGPGLVAFFRKQAVSEEQRRGIAGLIKQLGDNNFKVRETATKKLTTLGHAAAPALRQALDHRDVEVVRRAEQCLNALNGIPPGELRAAAARLLTARKPAGAVEALLAFLPDADPAEEDMLIGALTALGVRDGKADPALVAALTDKLPLRRAAAGAVLAAVPEHKEAVRKLLQDSQPVVRLRVALGLIFAKEKEAVPVLIEVLPQLTQPQTWQAEDILYRLTDGKSPPAAALGSDETGRNKCRDAWAAWWKDHGAQVNLAQLQAAPPMLGFTLIAELNYPRANSRVVEVDRNGKVRWQIDGLNWPADVRLLPGNRVLIAEWGANRVTERDIKGTILWQKNNLPGQPCSVTFPLNSVPSAPPRQERMVEVCGLVLPHHLARSVQLDHVSISEAGDQHVAVRQCGGGRDADLGLPEAFPVKVALLDEVVFPL